jgi:cohesin loading factor subunit SCC2
MKDSITRPDVTGQSSTTLPAYSRTVARKLIQDLDTEVRAGTEKSPRFMAVYGKLLNQHLSSDRPSELYVYVRQNNCISLVADECFTRCSKFRFPAGLDQVKKPPQRDGRTGLTSGLSPFAKMVLDGSDIAFNCKTFLLVFFLK